MRGASIFDRQRDVGIFQEVPLHCCRTVPDTRRNRSEPVAAFCDPCECEGADAVALAETLYDMNDPQIAHIREVLEFTGLSVPDVAAYERLAEYEREAAELGYPELK
jgi:hypothetical protein